MSGVQSLLALGNFHFGVYQSCNLIRPARRRSWPPLNSEAESRHCRSPSRPMVTPLRPQLPQLSSDTGFAARSAAFYAALFILNGIVLPFFPLWLRASGVDLALIGVILAAPQIMRFFAIPLVTTYANHHEAQHNTIVAVSALAAAGYALVASVDGSLAILC